MEVCRAIAKRATCDLGPHVMRHRAGTTRFLVTDTSDRRRGLPHSDEVATKIQESQHEDGTVTQHCMRRVQSPSSNAICSPRKAASRSTGRERPTAAYALAGLRHAHPSTAASSGSSAERPISRRRRHPSRSSGMAGISWNTSMTRSSSTKCSKTTRKRRNRLLCPLFHCGSIAVSAFFSRHPSSVSCSGNRLISDAQRRRETRFPRFQTGRLKAARISSTMERM
jgi:hypothetical protein